MMDPSLSPPLSLPPADAEATANLARTAFEAVRRMILTGELVGGVSLNERHLADRLGLSRTPVREALGRLIGEGYVTREGRRLIVGSIRVEDIMEILTVRRAVEGEAAEIAAGRGSMRRWKAASPAAS